MELRKTAAHFHLQLKMFEIGPSFACAYRGDVL